MTAQIPEKELLASFPQIAAPDSRDGYPGFLTKDQEDKLIQLRTLLEAHGYKNRLDDASLLRFLRARKFDIQLAMDMFIACEKWRVEYGTDTILQDFHYNEKAEVAKYYPQYYHKTDKDGRPVYIEQLGKVNITEMYKITTQERMLKNLVWEYEAFTQHRLPACSRMTGHLVETSCTILDLKGVSLGTASSVYGYLKEASNIGQNYYPERMGKFYVINAPFGFATVFSMIKRFLDPVTVTKIFVLGSKYQSELLKQIPAENLPVMFGGKSESVGGVALADDGPWRDEKFIGLEGRAPKSSAETLVQGSAVVDKVEGAVGQTA
ncbi:PI/PC TP protein [Nadsonia fulvescens var. elongata DSM 6958]|uniref:PI/PC TP protein n=1 Tax=Nadsonia fulvescens var. elongata DSM 6958 TaxID=857566 RepID=A0A1E3PJS3_9ASCO|nr:PI/PC TP protein [Nadsonia fulvescens var. elongata DSM 6958]